ncbi:MAG: NADPH-dependent assimilatory sulfite reductase hemoprotein subunit [Phycisphaerales bacterium]|nr:NADPH-dependent assimilatory sulfite reductase hemoprotein subunit [Phycisphaerales bacterium]
MPDTNKQTKVEQAKINSRFLRGSIAEDLLNEESFFEDDNVHLIKFHGIYQQDDRDARPALKAVGVPKTGWFMMRVTIPGGVLSAEQYLALDALADDVVYNHALRVTTRQNVQLHGLLKGEIKPAIQRISREMLSSLCGCGDVERNVMAPPAPYAGEPHRQLQNLARRLRDELCPRTNAYYEIWLDGDKIDTTQESEPLYGSQYLPRKFKTGIALPEDNSVGVYEQDVGLIALMEDGRLKGANVLVGGGMGMTHKNAKTYARLATPLGYVDAEHIVDAVRTVVAIFRDHGDRTDRRHARLKYLVEEWGIDRFREEFTKRANFPLEDWVDCGPLRCPDHLGKHEQGNDRYFYGVYIPNGRIIDHESCRFKTALRLAVESLRPEVILTPHQNIIFANLSEQDVKKLEVILESFGLPRVAEMTAVRKYAVACVALPTCGQALTESERVMPAVLDAFEAELRRLGVADIPLTLRMTGCPNGCSRPYTADLALVGHKPGHYDIFIGGALVGDRIADLFAVNVPRDQIVAAVLPILEAWAAQRMPEEGLGDFYQRVLGRGERRTLITGAKDEVVQDRVLARLA